MGYTRYYRVEGKIDSEKFKDCKIIKNPIFAPACQTILHP